MNEVSLVKVSSYQGDNATADKNGNMPVFLSLIAGVMPNRMVLSGTIAEREQLELNEVHLVHFVERESSTEFGRQFSVSSLGKVTPIDLLLAKKELGKAQMVNVDLPIPIEGQVDDVKSDDTKKK